MAPANFLFGTIMSEGGITGVSFMVSTVCSVLIGLFIAYMYTSNNNYSKSYIISLVLLPAIVQIVIMMVNGNIGAGVAVAGTFSLVRFRSAPGSGKEITSIFLAMAVGLATGMGYIGIAVIFAVIISLVNLFLTNSKFGEGAEMERALRITVPESLDFEGIFDDIFEKYTAKAELQEVKTSGMGSLYKLVYKVVMRPGVSTKAMIDEMRQRNGNLEISCSRPVAYKSEEL